MHKRPNQAGNAQGQGYNAVSRQDIAGVKGFVFDCDGVLIDSKAANVRFYNLILQKLGLPAMTPDCEAFVHAHTVQDSIAHIVPQALVPEAVTLKQAISYAQVVDSIRLEPDITECLDCLRRAGYRCAVNTNRTDTMEMILDRYALGGYFHPVVTSQDVIHPKPAPESLLVIVHAWELQPRELVFIGDSQVDEQTARAAGVPFWAYKNEGLRADRHLRDHRELAALVRC